MSTPGKSPNPDTLALSLARRVGEAGTIGFDEFMARALYDPELGYYSAPGRVGKRGDFFTSVSVGPIFGRLLAAQFAEMRERLGSPEDFTLVEQGAGDGQLAADVLAALGSHHGWTPRLAIVEPLPVLREAQREKLSPWAERVTWVSREDELPPFTGAHYSNELLDALPAKLVVRRDGRWLERRVGFDGEKFAFVEAPIVDPSLLAAAQALPIDPSVPEFFTELCPAAEAWVARVAPRLERGWVLAIDYGHGETVRCAAARAAGSLAAYQAHARAEDPLATPGEQDLTAHVNFTAVARAGERSGLALAGFTDQHHALTALAAQAFPPMADTPLDPGAAKEMRALRQLLHPESMGTAFKFLAMSKGAAAPLAAFRFARDARRELFG